MGQSVREWAIANGFTVGARGRLHADIISAYQEANGPIFKTAVKKAPIRKDISDIREWAKSNGHLVSEKGRISARIKKAYDKEHKPDVSPRVMELALAMVKERAAADAVELKDKWGRKYITQFCSGKNHELCPKVVMNGTLVGGIRKNVICSCECHNVTTTESAA